MMNLLKVFDLHLLRIDMDQFQLIIATKEWETLNTKAAKQRFIRRMYEQFASIDLEEGSPTPTEYKRFKGFLRKVIREVPADLLPQFIRNV